MKQSKKMNVFLRVAVAMVMLLLWGCSGGGGDGGSVQQTGTGSINGQVYEGDLNANRNLGNIPVTLFDGSGASILKTTFTNSTGLYHFAGVSDGNYKVRFTLNGSNYVWHQRKPDAVSADTVTVPSAATNAINLAVPYTNAENLGGGTILLSSNAATIYYTTNGTDPDTSSANGQNFVLIQIVQSTTLKYFSIIDGFIREAIKTRIFTP